MNRLDSIKDTTQFLEMLGVTPYERGKIRPDAWQLPVIVALIEELRDNGDCPSIVRDYNDPEFQDIAAPFRKDLSKVTLLEHSIEVAKAVVRDLRMSSRFVEHDLLNEIIMALAMDLGKIPAYRESGLYGSSEHQLVSASKLTEIEFRLFGKNSGCGPDDLIIKGIRGHHLRGIHRMADILRHADMEARKAELLRVRAGFREAPLKEWLDTEELVRRLSPKVNHLRNRQWQAFSHRGVVYVRPSLLYKVALKLAIEAQIIDLGLVYDSERDTALKGIVDIFKEKGLVPILDKAWFAAKFDIRGPFGNKVSVVTPLSGEIFNMHEIEKRKVGYLEAIKYVHLHKGIA